MLQYEQYRISLFVDATTRIIQAFGCGLTFLLLLLLLRQKAFNNPAKRFGLSLIFAFSLSSLNRVMMELSPSHLPLWLCRIAMSLYCLGSTIILYLVALPVALLVQVSSPIFPEQYRQKISSKIIFIEPFVQLLILSLSVLFNATQFVTDAEKSSNFCRRCITLYNYEVIALSFSVVALFTTILILGILYYKFRDTVVITKRTKWILLKVSALFLTIDAAFIGDAIVAASLNDFTYTLSITRSIFFTVVKLAFVLALIVLMYYPNTKCRLCCKQPIGKTICHCCWHNLRGNTQILIQFGTISMYSATLRVTILRRCPIAEQMINKCMQSHMSLAHEYFCYTLPQ